MAVDIHINRPGGEAPPLGDGQMRYVVARDGTYLERCTSMYTTSVRVDGNIPWLKPHEQRCVLHCGRIPLLMVRAMVGFFQQAYQLHGGEAALILLYHPEKRRFRWYCPVQTIEVYYSFGRLYASDSIEYENPIELPDGYIPFGDAHSHHGNPNPSWIDRDDEARQDGLHIIAGHIATRPSFHIDFGMDGKRFTVHPETVLTMHPELPYLRPPKAWLKQVRIVKRPPWYTLPANTTKEQERSNHDRNDHERSAGRSGNH